MPLWSRYLIELGYRIRKPVNDRQTITLVSMPCDSAGAGFVALGAIRKRMEIEGASDEAGHWQRIWDAAQRKMQLRLRKGRQNYVELDGLAEFRGQPVADKVRIKYPNQALKTEFLSREEASRYTIEGEQPVKRQDKPPENAREALATGDTAHDHEPLYNALPPAGHGIKTENLATRDSSICLVGRTTGRPDAERILEKINFRLKERNERHATLLDLLTIRAGKENQNSRRLNYFNLRNHDQPFETAVMPSLFVVDGIQAACKMLTPQMRTDPLCKHADFALVVSAIHEKDKLEEFSSALDALTDETVGYRVEQSGQDQTNPVGTLIMSLTRSRTRP